MKSFAELAQETADVQLDFLLTDLAAGNTFLDVAGTAQDSATRERNISNADAAHEAVTRFTPRVAMTDLQRQDVQAKLDRLMDRITTMKETGFLRDGHPY